MSVPRAVRLQHEVFRFVWVSRVAFSPAGLKTSQVICNPDTRHHAVSTPPENGIGDHFVHLSREQSNSRLRTTTASRTSDTLHAGKCAIRTSVPKSLNCITPHLPAPQIPHHAHDGHPLALLRRQPFRQCGALPLLLGLTAQHALETQGY